MGEPNVISNVHGLTMMVELWIKQLQKPKLNASVQLLGFLQIVPLNVKVQMKEKNQLTVKLVIVKKIISDLNLVLHVEMTVVKKKNVEVNTEKTACVCKTGYLEVSPLKCEACKDGALSCYCSDGWTGDDCKTAVKKEEDKSGNGFI